MGASNTKESYTSQSKKCRKIHNGPSPWRTVPFLPTSLRASLLHTVSCDAPPLPSPPPLTDPSSPPPPPSDDDTTIPPSSSTSLPPNPGPYEHAMMPSKRLTALDTFDGFRCDISKQLSPYMVVIHNFWLGTAMLPEGRTKNYSFVTQVADEGGLFMARLDPEKKSLDGRIHRSLLGGIAMGKIQIGAGPPGGDGQSDQMLGEVDFGGATWTGNLKYGSMGGGNVFGMNYYQSITDRLAMGGEGMYVAVNGSLLNSYTIRYEMEAPSGLDEEEANDSLNGNDAIAAAAASAAGPGSSPLDNKQSSWFLGNFNSTQGQLNLHYKRVVTPNRVTLGAELTCSPFTLESQVAFGAEFQLTRSKVALSVDGSGKLQTVLEAKLGMAPGSPSLNFSAEVDHGTDAMRFGYGLNIGG